MKNNLKYLFWLIPIAIFVQSCSYPKYLSKFRDFEQNVYGAQIYVNVRQNYGLIQGELLAVGDTSLFLLQNLKTNNIDRDSLIEVSFNSFQKYYLYVAKPENYAPSFLLNNLLTLSHGFFLVLTLPVNLIVTSAVIAGGRKSYKLTQRDVDNIQQLSKFSRFPVGIPDGFKAGVNYQVIEPSKTSNK